MAASPLSPVRTRVTESTAVAQTLPSPIFPVLAASAMTLIAFYETLEATKTSNLILGIRSTLY